MKVGILIPCTSKGRDWKNMKETYLYQLSLKTFIITMDKEHEYVFYIGIDNNDRIFDNHTEINELSRLINIIPNLTYELIRYEN